MMTSLREKELVALLFKTCSMAVIVRLLLILVSLISYLLGIVTLLGHRLNYLLLSLCFPGGKLA